MTRTARLSSRISARIAAIRLAHLERARAAHEAGGVDDRAVRRGVRGARDGAYLGRSGRRLRSTQSTEFTL